MANKKIEYHKVVDILIFNDKGELALQLRSLKDKSFPGYWDFSAGGHIDKNEENEKVAEREVFEELGVKEILKFVSHEHFQYQGWDPSVTRKVDASIYKIVYGGSFKIDPKEVEKVSFFKLPIIQKMIDDGIKIHPEFLLAWNKGVVAKAIKI